MCLQGIHALLPARRSSNGDDSPSGGFFNTAVNMCQSCDAFQIGSASCLRCSENGCSTCDSGSGLFQDKDYEQTRTLKCITSSDCRAQSGIWIPYQHQAPECTSCFTLVIGGGDDGTEPVVGSCNSDVAALTCTSGIRMSYTDFMESVTRKPHAGHPRSLLADDDSEPAVEALLSRLYFCVSMFWCDASLGFYIEGSGEAATCRQCPDYCPGDTCTGPYLVSVMMMMTDMHATSRLCRHMKWPVMFAAYTRVWAMCMSGVCCLELLKHAQSAHWSSRCTHVCSALTLYIHHLLAVNQT